MNVKELLKLGEPIFSKIDKLVKAEKYEEAYELIDSSEPPKEWILELPSKSSPGETYKALPIDLMEAAMRRIFGSAGIETINQPTIVSDKGRFAVTVVVSYYYNAFELKSFPKTVDGIATVSCNDISLLELASPKASTMAVKNAIKQLGGLFGKYLNRPVEDVEFPGEEQEIKLTPEELAKNIAQKLLSCKTYDELKSYRLVVFDKKMPLELQSLYENRLRELAKTAKSIG